MLYTIFKKVWAPLLLSFPVRILVLIVFFAWGCISLALVPRIDVGLDPETVLPEDSHVSQHFKVGTNFSGIYVCVQFFLL